MNDVSTDVSTTSGNWIRPRNWQKLQADPNNPVRVKHWWLVSEKNPRGCISFMYFYDDHSYEFNEPWHDKCMDENELVFCSVCRSYCRFRCIEKHCRNIKHRRNM